MNTNILNELIPQDFSDNSRVWIFQSSRPFSDQEESFVNLNLEHFYAQWQAHGAPVKGWGKLLFNRFIVILADEAQSNMVSGCSTDGMVRVIKSMEKQFSVDLFDRLTLMFWINDKVQGLPLSQLEYAMNQNYISGDTLYFNNVVTNKSDLMSNWIVPLKESWIKDRIKL